MPCFAKSHQNRTSVTVFYVVFTFLRSAGVRRPAKAELHTVLFIENKYLRNTNSHASTAFTGTYGGCKKQCSALNQTKNEQKWPIHSLSACSRVMEHVKSGQPRVTRICFRISRDGNRLSLASRRVPAVGLRSAGVTRLTRTVAVLTMLGARKGARPAPNGCRHI